MVKRCFPAQQNTQLDTQHFTYIAKYIYINCNSLCINGWSHVANSSPKFKRTFTSADCDMRSQMKFIHTLALASIVQMLPLNSIELDPLFWPCNSNIWQGILYVRVFVCVCHSYIFECDRFFSSICLCV